jgi:hypothetical protein
MSAMLTARPPVSSTLKHASRNPLPEPEQPRSTSQVKHFNSEAEPSEESIRVTEAPEWWHHCHAEAPDAGRGASDNGDREFTEGRSRS